MRLIARLIAIVACCVAIHGTELNATPLTTRVPQTLLRLEGAVYAFDYGATGNGVTDDTAALQLWINACQTANVICFLNPGTYIISSTLNVTSSVHIVGASRTASTLMLNTTTLFGIDVKTTAQVTFENFGFNASGTQTAGSAILVDAGGSGENDESQFVGLYFVHQWTAINFERAAYWTIDRSHFLLCVAQCVVIQNLNSGDAGDSSIQNSIFLYGSSINNSNQVAVFWLSSGGLRVVNNKLVNGFRGIQYALSTGVNTGTFVTDSNSFENFYDSGIFISENTPGNGTISKMTITGNEFLGFGSAYGIRVFSTSTASWFTGLTISGNVMQLNGNGVGGASPHGIDLVYLTNASINGNMIWCAGAVSSSYGIVIGSSVSGVGHGGNSVLGCNTDVSDSSTGAPTPY